MTSGVNIKAPNFQKLGASIQENIGREFATIMSDEVTAMKLRTTSGYDYKGKAFKKYAPSTIKIRKAAGRNTTFVDLTFTGKMLQSLTYNINIVGNVLKGIIFFQSPSESEKARFNLELGRDFFGISSQRLTKIKQRIQGKAKP